MNLTWSLGGLVVAGSVALLLFQRGEPETTPGKPLPSQAEASPAAVKAATPPRAGRIPAMRLLGLIHQGAASSAMVEVEGVPAQPFRAGDAVSADWVLQQIGVDHIIVGNGAQHARVELEMAQAATLNASPQQKTEAAAERKPDPMLGPPVAVVPDEVARENNRRFVEAVRRRNAGM